MHQRTLSPEVAAVSFPVKTITWSQYEQKTPILLQDKNGPCPLIALVNTLLLSADIEARTVELEASMAPTEGSSAPLQSLKKEGAFRIRELLERHVGKEVPLASLLSTLGDVLLDMASLDSAVVNQLLENLPLLHTGLSVNPNLVTGTFPLDDLAFKIFDAFGLKFVHGWCWEPQPGTSANEVFEQLETFDALQDYLLKDSECNQLSQKEVQFWLEDNRTQLTDYGLLKLDQEVHADQVAIFFRNNHFSTIYKAHNHDFYLLVTDTVFAKRSLYVWQSLISVSGHEDLFFTGEFIPVIEGDDYDEDDDQENLRLARKLQEEEDEAMAKSVQKKFDSRRSKQRGVAQEQKQQQQPEQPEDAKKKKKGRPNCVIV